jgi:hypothetical protein
MPLSFRAIRLRPPFWSVLIAQSGGQRTMDSTVDKIAQNPRRERKMSSKQILGLLNLIGLGLVALWMMRQGNKVPPSGRGPDEWNTNMSNRDYRPDDGSN